jgi:hypothetical protein
MLVFEWQQNAAEPFLTAEERRFYAESTEKGGSF